MIRLTLWGSKYEPAMPDTSKLNEYIQWEAEFTLEEILADIFQQFRGSGY